MNNDMLYTMFLNTLSKMNETDLKESLEKAKGVLSASDYEKLVHFIEEERKKKT